MNNLKCIILLLFSVLGLFANAEDETITFLPSVDKSTKTSHNTSKVDPDVLIKDGVIIACSDADFRATFVNNNSYRTYVDAVFTFTAEANIKSIKLSRYTGSSSSKIFKANTTTNNKIGMLGKLNVKDDEVVWTPTTESTNTVSFCVNAKGPVWLSSIEVTVEKKTGEQITLSSLGYGTMYYGTKALVVPSGIEAMTYTVSGNKLVCSKKYTEGETIPQATGVVLKGDAGTYTFNYSDETGVAPSGNLLSGSDAEQATSGAGLFYKLAQDPDNAQNVGFFWGADNGGAFTNGAHKAYLCVPASAGVRAFILLNEEATAINKLSTDIQTHETYYTLGGQQLSEKPAKGAVIVSKGKKFVVR